MSVIDYREKDSHPGGFRGFRVVRKINGESIQFYFPAKQERQARVKDKQLQRLQNKAKQHGTKAGAIQAKPFNYTAKRYDAPKRTKIKGLVIALQPQSKSSTNLHYPCILIAANARSTARIITPGTRDLTTAWRESCKLLAEFKELKRVPSHWYKATPTVQQFVTLLHFYRKRGNKIPRDTLDYLRSL